VRNSVKGERQDLGPSSLSCSSKGQDSPRITFSHCLFVCVLVAWLSPHMLYLCVCDVLCVLCVLVM
jgi:hypothetical protein